MKNGDPHHSVLNRTKLFHTDSVLCGISALALKTNAPTVLAQEALKNSDAKRPNKQRLGYAKVFGNQAFVPVDKAICANVSAVREW